MTVIAILLTDDDAVLAEMALPSLTRYVKMAVPIRPTKAWVNDNGDYEAPTIRCIEFEVSQIDSLAAQLAHDYPDVWVYRKRVTP
jgi:hypothetical protein